MTLNRCNSSGLKLGRSYSAVVNINGNKEKNAQKQTKSKSQNDLYKYNNTMSQKIEKINVLNEEELKHNERDLNTTISADSLFLRKSYDPI